MKTNNYVLLAKPVPREVKERVERLLVNMLAEYHDFDPADITPKERAAVLRVFTRDAWVPRLFRAFQG